MSRRAPMNPGFRPHPIVTAEIDRSAAAADRLLATPADWLRRVHCARLDVELEVAEPCGVLDFEGFRSLCTAWLRYPGLAGRIEQRVDVLVDRSTAIRAEVVGDRTRRVYFTTLFDDGTSLISVADSAVAAWIRSDRCDVLAGTGDLPADLAAFRARLREHEIEGRAPLLCANGAAYRVHMRLGALQGSKLADRSIGPHGLLYPMTLMLAAQMVARRDAQADQRGLPGSSGREH